MSDNKFTESMEVEAVGNLKPGDIGWGTCDGCEKNIHKFPGVLLQGVTQEAAKLLYEKVEIVAEGTKAKMEELEASNKELLEALEVAQQFILNGIQYGYINMPDKDCGDSALETPAIIEAAIQKALMADFVYQWTCKYCNAVRRIRTPEKLTTDKKRWIREMSWESCPVCQFKANILKWKPSDTIRQNEQAKGIKE